MAWSVIQSRAITFVKRIDKFHFLSPKPGYSLRQGTSYLWSPILLYSLACVGDGESQHVEYDSTRLRWSQNVQTWISTNRLWSNVLIMLPSRWSPNQLNRIHYANDPPTFLVYIFLRLQVFERGGSSFWISSIEEYRSFQHLSMILA